MQSKNAPYIDGATVSATETPVRDCDSTCPPRVISEQEAIGALVKWWGWRCWEAGQLVRVEDARRSS